MSSGSVIIPLNCNPGSPPVNTARTARAPRTGASHTAAVRPATLSFAPSIAPRASIAYNEATMTSYVTLALVVIVLVWFAAGIQWNIRKGNLLLRWLQQGLPLLGRRTTLRWLGSSVVELKIAEAAAPFVAAEVLVVLEPRDVGPIWGWGRLHGRRDFLILRGRLERPPRFEVEAGDRRSWTGRDTLRRLAPSAWQHDDWGDANVYVAHSGGRAPEVARRHWEDFQRSSHGVWRLSIRRTPPHLEVHLMPPDPARVGAEPIFRTFRDLSRTLTAEP
jgi:hypothetical protein